MFNNDEMRKPLDVRMFLSDGRNLEGKLMLPMSIDIKRVLSGDNPLLEFEDRAGCPSLIAKSAIIEIALADIGTSSEQKVASADVAHGPSRLHGADA